MSISIIQRRLHLNKDTIKYLEHTIELYRADKTYCDEQGLQEAEYCSHNELKLARAELKKYVKEQKFLKQLIKEI